MVFSEIKISNAETDLAKLSDGKPVLLIFLRHFGCTFCREALADISKKQAEFAMKGVKMVLVHMSTNEIADEYFAKYNISNPLYISDPECNYYKQFGLLKGNFNQLFGFRSFIRGVEAGLVKGHGVGKLLGDGFQMPGVFLIYNSKIEEQFIHKFASDRPDYINLINCCVA